MSVVGLDVGNDSCVVAVARRRVIDILQNLQGSRKTPSLIAFSGKQRLSGADAVAQFTSNYKNSVSLFKRLLGIQYDDCKDVDLDSLPFKTVKMPNGTVGVEVQYDDQPTVMAMEQIVAGMLQSLKTVAEAGLDGQRVVDCVLACPSYWTEERRLAYLDAASIAGLNVLRLVNETTAVALTYGILRPLPENEQRKVMFIDVGHADTKVGVAAFQAGKLQMLGVSSDRNLGVLSFSELLVDHFADYIKEKYKMDVRTDRKAMIKLRKECTSVMKVLSANQNAPFNVEYIMNDRDVSGEITRQQFEEMAQKSLLARFAMPIEEALALAGVKKTELFSVEVVGGGVRIPMVQKTLKDIVGKDLSFTCDGDESVARGCALFCAMASPSFKVRDFQVQDLTPYAIDVAYGAAGDDLNALKAEDTLELIKQGAAVPAQKMISFKDRREPMQIDLRYHSPALLPPGTNPVLSRYIVSGAPKEATANASKPPKMKIRIDVDVRGIVSVSQATWLQEYTVEEEIKEKVDVKVATKPETPADKPADKADGKTEAPAADAAAGDAKPMDVEEPASENESTAESVTAEAAADVPAEPEKKKTKTVTKTERMALKIDRHQTAGMTQADLNAFFEKEAAMVNADRVIKETNDARNALESYVLEMRGDIRGELAEYIKLEAADKFCEACDKEEEWLYEDGYDCQKSEYVKHLKVLQDQAEPARKRKYEAEHRMEYIANLKKTIGQYQHAATSAEEKYAHIAAEEKAKVVKACEETDQWLIGMQVKQDKLSKSDDPAATCLEFEQKRKSLETLAHPILNKPKPKPKPAPKKEEAKKEEKPAKGDKGDKDEEMNDPAAAAAPDAAPADAAPADAAAASSEETPAAMDVEEPK